jgi:hypothetical protein
MKKLLVIAVLSSFLTLQGFCQINITPNTNTVQLVNDFILTGVTASNVNYTGAGNTLGTFNNGNSTNIGIPDGIIMTTGSFSAALDSAIGSPAIEFASYANNGNGDATLNSLLMGFPTYDASVLEFDLVPVGNVLEFDYVFASEEYPEFVNAGFNDIFGFFINGANPLGGNYSDSNIALIPGVSIPVSIDNVNASTNSSYFIDNLGANGQTIVFDGFTTVMLAHVNVIPYNSYHLKMVIADVGDGIFDSGIFLKTKSMKSYIITGVNEKNANSCSVNPNPVTDQLNVQLPSENFIDGLISIYDIQGQLIMQEMLNVSNAKIDVSNLLAGVYFAKITNNEKIEVIRIVKN